MVWLWFLGLLLPMMTVIRAQTDIDLAQIDNVIDVGPFVDTDACYDALIVADDNPMDNKVDRQEYVVFVQEFGPPGFLAGITQFEELPVVLKLNFNTLACLCNNDPTAADDCCVGDNAHISNEGAAEGLITPYLFSVCLFTDTSIQRVLASGAPSVSPTMSPSEVPSDVPTIVPSTNPTVTPGNPTMAPTESAPSESPSAAPSPDPTTPPPATPMPTPDSGFVMTPYEIAVAGGATTTIPVSEYEGDLIGAMDIVATNLALGEFRRNLRRLTVTVQTPTQITGTFVTVCPAGVAADDECRDVNPLVILDLTGEEDPVATTDAFEMALNQSIFDGDLQDALMVVNASSVVRVISGALTPSPSPDSGDDGISSGGIAGIVIAGVVVWVAVVGYFLVRKRRRDDKEHPYFPSDGKEPQDAKSGTTLGAVSPSYGKGSSKKVRSFDGLEEGVAAKKSSGDDSSSNAGSSGWSSSAGVSSLDSEGKARGTTLAEMGVASARSAKKIESGDVPDLPTVTREDLDNAIDSGDWAAVGATAALLAAASDSQSFSSRSKKSGASASKGSTVSSIDAARAAELDHLVDAGDWEGVVLAAARFEKSEGDSSTSKSGSGSKTSQSGSATRSGTAESGSRSATGSIGTSSYYSQGETTSVSESPSKAAKRAEIRQEVEALVRRVVPDEIDNVDEMMLQFKGREEELVETLRTMQERSIAQRARAADRKSAKIQARDDVRRSREGAGGAAAAATIGAGDAGGGLSGAAVAGIAAGGAVAGAAVAGVAVAATRDSKDKGDKRPMHEEEGAAVPALKDEGEATEESERKKRRTALEEAIDAGDWEAVGEAAAMMSDASITTASSRSFTASLDTADSSSRKRRTGVNADRAAELDALIDKGDWTGVMAAASAFSKSDKEGKSTGSGSSPDSKEESGKSTGSGSASRRSWFGRKKSDKEAGESESVDSSQARAKALKEEQDALAQAEVWMQIAEQSKAEGSTEEAGASDAADWAIARSLSALRHAEAGGELKPDSARKATETVDEASTEDKSV